jgi:hypothetical protein
MCKRLDCSNYYESYPEQGYCYKAAAEESAVTGEEVR